MKEAICVENLWKTFGNFHAVQNVSFQVAPGELFGYLGANGAGKTTTIKILCGVLKATSGSLKIYGEDIIKHPQKIKTMVGYMSQKFSLYKDLTVLQNLKFFGALYGMNPQKLKNSIDHLSFKLNLHPLLNLKVDTLPGGLQQRAALANALIHEPRLLFLDEPTAGVDPLSRREFMILIQERLKEGTTIFLTTHYLDEAEYCHRIALMAAGKLVALGTPLELKKKYAHEHASLDDVFFEIVKERV